MTQFPKHRNALPALLREPVAFVGDRIEINWAHLISRRPGLLDSDNEISLPAYLLLPEIHSLLDIASHGSEHLMLATLWHTGARVSELLALTRESFTLADEWKSEVKLKTLKKPGRPAKDAIEQKGRRVPITDPVYLLELERYFAMNTLRKSERIFPFTRQAVDQRIRRLVARLGGFGIDVSAHTFRHSFACNAVLHGIPLTVIRDWLGHKNTATTEIYTRVLTSETHHLMQRIAF